MKTIGIVGSRRRNTKEDFELVKVAFREIVSLNDKICSGGCPQGGDRFAEMIAKETGIPITIFYPAWAIFGRSAGFQRNTSIAQESNILIACVAEDRKGGTEDTIKKWKKLNPNLEPVLV